MHECPHCAGTGKIDALQVQAASIATLVIALQAACAADGANVTGDGRVDEATAARLVGRSKGTLRNWRAAERPIPYLKRRRGVLYSLEDIAAWMVAAGEMPQF